MSDFDKSFIDETSHRPWPKPRHLPGDPPLLHYAGRQDVVGWPPACL